MNIIKRIFLLAVAAMMAVVLLAGCAASTEEYAEYVVGGGDAPFTTNTKLDENGKSAYVKMAVVLQLNSEAGVATLEEMEARIRDTILFILRAYTAEQYKEEDTHLDIRAKIVAELTENLGVNFITGVLITDFVVQG